MSEVTRLKAILVDADRQIKELEQDNARWHKNYNDLMERAKVIPTMHNRIEELERVAKMALEMLDLCNKNGWMLADYEGQMYEAFAALREVLGENK